MPLTGGRRTTHMNKFTLADLLTRGLSKPEQRPFGLAGILSPSNPMTQGILGLQSEKPMQHGIGLAGAPHGILNLGLMPAAQPRTIADEAYEQFPRLKTYGFQFMDSRGDPSAANRHLETYPADERDNPMPGKPTIRQFNPKASPKDFLGETLHILPKIDPYVGSLRDYFVRSMTPQQQAQLRRQYEYHRQNYGEQRPFNQWAEVSGIDAWFRGHVTGQWPADMYTPEQLKMFQSLEQYLSR